MCQSIMSTCFYLLLMYEVYSSKNNNKNFICVCTHTTCTWYNIYIDQNKMKNECV